MAGTTRSRILAVLLLALIGNGARADVPVIENGDFSQADESGMPQGWTLQLTGIEATLDADERVVGTHSLRLSGPAQAQSAFVSQQMDAEILREQGLVLTGYIRTRGILQSATLVIVVNGPEGPLFTDDMSDRVIRGDSEWHQATIEIPSMAEARTLTVAALVIGPGSAWFDGFELVPGAPAEVVGESEVRAYVEAAFEALESQYVNARDVDWAAIRADTVEAWADVDTLDGAHALVGRILQRLDERHASLLRPARDPASRATAVEAAILPVKVELHRERLAHVVVPGFPGGAEAAAMNAFASEAQARMRDVDDGSLCGWIVDLRDNAGGNGWPMLGALGPLMGEGELGGGWVDAEGNRLDAVPWYRDGVVGIDSEDGRVERIVIDGAPFVPSRPAMPVAVLLSGRTASSGEGVAVAFAGLDHARSFGEHTVGLTSANVPHVLPDGALLVFPVGYPADRKGRVYPSGIAPDQVTRAEAALEEAERWLLAQPACSGD